MRKILNSSLLAGVLLLLTSCSGSFSDPIEYNNKMMTIINSVQEDQGTMNEAMIADELTKAEEFRATWITHLEKSIDEVSKTGDFKGDSSLKDALTTGLTQYKDIVAKDYKEYIEARKGTGEEAENKADDILTKINEKLDSIEKNVNTAAEAFQSKISQ